MADDSKKTPTTASEGDGVPRATPIPNAKAEPVTQEAATSGSSARPPLPADYEMPDDYAGQDWLTQTKGWVEEHPGLAILAASGIGLLAGRIVSGLFPDPEPSLADRVEDRARVYKKEASKRSKAYKKEASKRAKGYRKASKKEIAAFRKDPGGYAEDIGDSLEESLHRAAEAIRGAAGQAGDVAEEGYEKTMDFAETVSDAVKVALTGVVAAKIDDWVDKVRR